MNDWPLSVCDIFNNTKSDFIIHALNSRFNKGSCLYFYSSGSRSRPRNVKFMRPPLATPWLSLNPLLFVYVSMSLVFYWQKSFPFQPCPEFGVIYLRRQFLFLSWLAVLRAFPFSLWLCVRMLSVLSTCFFRWVSEFSWSLERLAVTVCVHFSRFISNLL